MSKGILKDPQASREEVEQHELNTKWRSIYKAMETSMSTRGKWTKKRERKGKQVKYTYDDNMQVYKYIRR